MLLISILFYHLFYCVTEAEDVWDSSEYVEQLINHFDKDDDPDTRVHFGFAC